MFLTWFLFSIIIILFLLSLVMLEWPSLTLLMKSRKIHGPWVFPLIGGINLVMTVKSVDDVMDIIKEYTTIYKRLIRFPLGGVHCFLVQEPDDIQVLLGSTTHIRKGREYTLLLPWLNEGLLTSYGNKWHSRRKLLTPTFHFRILEDSINGINKSTTILVDKLAKTSGNVIALEEYITKCTLDIIGDTAMGIDLKAQSESGKSYLQSVKRTSAAVILRILSIWQFQDYMFKISQNGKQFYKSLKILHNFTDKTIQERKQQFKANSSYIDSETETKTRKPFLDCLLETQITHPEMLSDLDIREEVDTFMFEGHDTTSTALSFALWLLGSNPREQNKAYEELTSIFGNEERDVTTADAHNMVYMEKVIKETLRLYPSVPYISRSLDQDLFLEDGTVIPERANVIVMPYFLHRNPNYFPDPEKFDPERFSEDNSVGRHPFCYIPFSAGPRNCIGQKFAMLEMKVTLAKILRKLSVTAITKNGDFKVLPYLIVRPTKPLLVKFTPRN